MTKLLVLGYDGLDPLMLDYMPVLRSKFRSAKLDTIIPLTYPSWTTIMTGVPPDIHGILDFFYYYKDNRNTWKTRLYTANDLKYPRLHEILHITSKNIKYAVIDPIPPTPIHPPKRDNFIGRIWGVGLDPLSVPKDYLSKFFDTNMINKLIKYIRNNYNCNSNLEKAVEIIHYYHDGVEKLLKQNYDLVWVTMNLPDLFIHRCRESLHRIDKYLKPVLVELDNLAKTAQQNCPNTIIVSDHGFSTYKYRVNINRLLYDHGLLKPGRGGHNPLSQLLTRDRKHHRTVIPQIAISLARNILSRNRVLRNLSRKILLKLDIHIATHPMIDEELSKAYSPVPLTTQIPPIFVVLVNDPDYIEDVTKIIEEHAGVMVYIPRSKYPVIYVIPSNNRFPVPGSIKSPLVEELSVENHSLYGVVALDIEGLSRYSGLPEILPSTTIAPLSLCILGIPYGEEMPSRNLASEICGKSEENLGLIRYSKRWIIYRKIQQRLKPSY